MKFEETKLAGCYIITPNVFGDSRGYFLESYNQHKFNQVIPGVTFVQDNESFSSYGVIRGLHYQQGNYAQAKLVRAVKGAVIDVAVDLRKNSKTFGQHVAVELSEQNKRQLFVPRGFAHGFSVISESAIFAYKCDNLYAPEKEAGVLFKDQQLAINWQIPEDKQIVSEKDLKFPEFSNAIYFG